MRVPLLLASLLACSAASAQVLVSMPTVRATTAQQHIAVATATIRNAGSSPDTLLSVTSPAGAVMLHHVITTNGVRRMTMLPHGITIPAHGFVDLDADDDHVMFSGLTRQLRVGDSVLATLRFQRMGLVQVRFKVVAIR